MHSQEHHHHEHGDQEHRFHFTQFFIVTGVQVAGALLLYRWLAPSVFAQETSSFWPILGWVFLFGLPLSLFEYLYHRYLLHASVLPFLGSMHRAHTSHHGLTSVKAPVRPDEPAMLVPVENEYPVEHEHQEAHMMFPVYAITIFNAIFLVLFGLPAKLLFPGSPAILALLIAVALFYSGYEVWHAMTHLPFERFWKPLMESKRVGGIAKRVYGFHLMHHVRPACNLAVVGFWGFAIWDHLFRTHRRPERLPLKGREVNYEDVALPKPRWPIAILDSWKSGCYKWSRKVEKGAWLLLPKKWRRNS